MKRFTSYTEGRRIKTVGFDMISKAGKIGGDSDAKKSRGGVERYEMSFRRSSNTICQTGIVLNHIKNFQRIKRMSYGMT